MHAVTHREISLYIIIFEIICKAIPHGARRRKGVDIYSSSYCKVQKIMASKVASHEEDIMLSRRIVVKA